jgi:hypothetical protein
MPDAVTTIKKRHHNIQYYGKGNSSLLINKCILSNIVFR